MTSINETTVEAGVLEDALLPKLVTEEVKLGVHANKECI